MSQRLVDPALVDTSGDRPRLVGGRRLSDGKVVFPMPAGGEAQLYEPLPLSTEGSLWSFTVQRFRPKSPPYKGDENFQPFALGYIELDEIIVESRIEIDDFSRLRIGQPMTMKLAPFRKDPDGTEVLTYAFAPID
jgi:uncharacterized OB-fold protein